ncbi:MAG TPA: hypothetical protein VII43_09320, partial [Opitutaceae bacterium]
MPPMRVFTARDTGVRTMAWSAAQDRSGVLYFGCDEVVSFDGERWRPEHTELTYGIRGLDVGPNGRIWVAGVNQIGWLEPGAPGHLAYHSLMPSLPAALKDLGDVWRVYSQGTDKALFVTRDRILRWDGSKMTSWDYPGMRLLWSTRTDKAIYVHYPPLGLMRIGDNGPEVIAPESVIGAADIRWLDDTGDAWLLLTADGFRLLRNGACASLETDASHYMRTNTPTSVVRLRDGSHAIGTLLGGIAIVDPSGRLSRVFDEKTGLPANQVYSLFLDRDGALWSMGPSHIVRLAIGSGVAVYGERTGYPPGGCEAVAEFAGSTFAASQNDLFRLSEGDAPRGAQFRALGITSRRFYSLLAMPQGLVVADYHGIGLWTPAGIRQVIESNEVVFRTSPSRSRPGTILAAQSDRVLSVDLESGRTAVIADSLPDYGDSLVDEPTGRIWIGTGSRGLFVTVPGTTRFAPASPRFGSLPTSGPALVSTAGSTVVAVTTGAAYWLDAHSDRFRRIRGFPAGNPSAISNSDSSGAVWAALEAEAGGHSPRIGKISFDGTRASWTPSSIEGLSSVGSLLALRIIRGTGSEALWIAGSEALLRAGPKALAERSPPRRPTLRAWIREGAGDREMGASDTLPYSTRLIHVEYGSLEF